MAHENYFERRDAVTEMAKTGYTLKRARELAVLFGCTLHAIRSDYGTIIRLEGGIFWPTKAQKHEILARDGYTCQYCGKNNIQVICEHVIPQITGGVGMPYNLVAACYSCNSTKRSNVWVPNNIDLLSSINKNWVTKIRELATERVYGKEKKQQRRKYRRRGQKENT